MRVAVEPDLVPMDLFRREARLEAHAGAALASELQRLARIFKVSTLVVLRRFHDAGGLTREAFWLCYREELDRLREIVRARKKGGGDYYRTLPTRVSHRLTRALVESTLEGRTSFTEAFRLLGMRKMQTFRDGPRLPHGLLVGGSAREEQPARPRGAIPPPRAQRAAGR
jgi:hypothetical protein